MNYEVLEWSWRDFPVPVIGDGKDIFTTTKVVAGAYGVGIHAIHKMASRYSDEFSQLSLTKCSAKEVLEQNRDLFGIERLRSDMRLWNEDDILGFGFFLTSKQAQLTRRWFREEAKKYVLLRYRPVEELEALQKDRDRLVFELSLRDEALEDVRAELSRRGQQIDLLLERMEAMASSGGRMLRDWRDVKKVH